jgi:hypothetical protein
VQPPLVRQHHHPTLQALRSPWERRPWESQGLLPRSLWNPWMVLQSLWTLLLEPRRIGVFPPPAALHQHEIMKRTMIVRSKT